MQEEKEKQMDMDVIDTTDEQAENNHPAQERIPQNSPPTTAINEELEALFEDDEARKFRSQWLNIQSKFVDDPRESVKQADELVANVLKSVTMSFAEKRISLEKQWNSGENASTEDLRVALKRYRSFFDRLLTLES